MRLRKPNHQDQTRDAETLQFIENQLKIAERKDWYQITQQDIIRHGGSSLLSKHGHFPFKMLQKMYPEHPWALSSFRELPRRFWKSLDWEKDVPGFVEWLGKQLEVETLEDWYRVSMSQISRWVPGRIGGKSVEKWVQLAYPEHPWEEGRFRSGGMRASQRRLVVVVRKLFPRSGTFVAC